MKKVGLLAMMMMIAFYAFPQSKKALLAELETLKAEKDSLQSKINALLAPVPVNLEDDWERVSYSLGVSISTDFKAQGFDGIIPKIVAKGMEDVFNNSENTLIDPTTASRNIGVFFQQIKAERDAAMIETGKAYLAENSKKEGVNTTPSGLQYEIITEGNGPSPQVTDKVTVHYTGTLTDGSVFDSSVERGQPATFGVDRVIAGWTEALQLMKVGDKWKLTIPSELAYGERGAGAKIGPHAVLIFEVELLGIEGK